MTPAEFYPLVALATEERYGTRVRFFGPSATPTAQVTLLPEIDRHEIFLENVNRQSGSCLSTFHRTAGGEVADYALFAASASRA